MKVQIFTVHHQVPQSYIATELFVPFVTGVEVDPRRDLLCDAAGDNIADRAGYSEMRAHYYVWKNLAAGLDYVGFQHYRRAFLFQFMVEPNGASEFALAAAALNKFRRLASVNVDRATFLRYLTWLESWREGQIALFREWLGHFDVVVPRPMVFGVPIGAQYAELHRAEEWDRLVEAARQHPRFARAAGYFDVELPRLFPCNMFIMRNSLLCDYMSLWHDIATQLERSIPAIADPYQARAVGFLSERLFTIYLYHLQIERPSLRVLELPYLIADTNEI